MKYMTMMLLALCLLTHANGEKYALIISNTKYDQVLGSPLKQEKNDSNLRRVLEYNKFEVTMHTNLDSLNTIKALNDFSLKYGNSQHNTLLIYFSGRSYMTSNSWGTAHYLLPIDTPINAADKHQILHKAIDLEYLKLYAKKIEAKQALFVLNIGAISDVKIKKDKNKAYIREFIISTKDNRSKFAKLFATALQSADSNFDTNISAEEITSYMNLRSANNAENGSTCDLFGTGFSFPRYIEATDIADNYFQSALYYYYFDIDHKKSWEQITKACSMKQDPRYILQKSKMLFLGHGVAKDQATAIVEAKDNFTRLKNQADAFSLYLIGWLYSEGLGVVKNHREAVYWNKKAAEQGFGVAMNNLGFQYLHGIGLDKDPTRAVYWLRRAAEAKVPHAMMGLGSLYYQGQHVEKNETLALKWFSNSAKKNFYAGIIELSKLYIASKNYKNYDKAIKWLLKAHKIDNREPICVYLLASLYQSQKNTQKTNYYYKLLVNIANSYEKKDKASAIRWYENCQKIKHSSSVALRILQLK